MIYIKRTPSLIPEKVLKVAARAQDALEKLPPEKRGEFLRKKSHIWRAFAKYLANMSYGKCWYSETRDPHSRFDVDHFRPKAEAKRSEKLVEDGYPWLAFDWHNFRYSSQLSNQLSKDQETGETLGKGSWFPLLEASPTATWDDRCEANERPSLLDPTVEADVALITVADDGRVTPSKYCVGPERNRRVAESVKILGLNLGLREERQKLIREVIDLHEALQEDLALAAKFEAMADNINIDRHIQRLKRWTYPDKAFSLTVRAALQRLNAAELCAQPEEWSSPTWQDEITDLDFSEAK